MVPMPSPLIFRNITFRLCVLLLAFAFVPSVAHAHPEGFSGIHVKIGQDSLRVEITVHTRDMGAWFPPARYPDYVADITSEMEKTIDEIVEVHFDEQPQPVSKVHAFLLEVGLIQIDVDYRLPAIREPIEILIWSKHLIHLPRGHQQLLFVEDRREVTADEQTGVMRLDDVLTIDRDAGAVILPPLESAATTEMPDTEANPEARDEETPGQAPDANPDKSEPTSADPRKPKVGEAAEHPSSRISFFLFGVEHIITGYDHLLFLAALLLACRTFGEAATIITCFTVAHSVTLALAALDVVRMPSSVVEPLIALSIFYVAVENLVTKPTMWRRIAITCFFGLIHGLGFASALRDIGLGSIPGGVVLPLLKFNLGVEAGQLCVAAVLLPILLGAKKSERLAEWILAGGSLFIAAIGAYWFVTRVYP